MRLNIDFERMKEIYGDEIEEIINENIDIDKLLVVTFTNAAATEMRERILKALYEDTKNKNSFSYPFW